MNATSRKASSITFFSFSWENTSKIRPEPAFKDTTTTWLMLFCCAWDAAVLLYVPELLHLSSSQSAAAAAALWRLYPPNQFKSLRVLWKAFRAAVCTCEHLQRFILAAAKISGFMIQCQQWNIVWCRVLQCWYLEDFSVTSVRQLIFFHIIHSNHQEQ